MTTPPAEESPVKRAVAETPTERALGGAHLLALGVNGVVGVGIFFVPSEVVRLAPGAWSILVWVGTAVALLPAALCVAHVGGQFHEDGGAVLYARRTFGDDRWAFAVGWLAYASALFSTAAVFQGLSRSLQERWGAGSLPSLASWMLLGLGLVAACGLRVSARFWTALTVLKLVPLLALAGSFAWALVQGGASSMLSSPLVSSPLASSPLVSSFPRPDGWQLLRAALTATFAFQGFEIVPVLAGQAKAPERTIPRAVMSTVALAATLYVVLHCACLWAVPDLGAAATPLVEAATRLGGPPLGALVHWGTDLSGLGIAFGMVSMTPRYLAALASVAPASFQLDATSGSGVPLRNLGATLALVWLLLLMGSLGELLSLSSMSVVLQYAITAATCLRLPRSSPEMGLRSVRWTAIPTLVLAAILLLGATSHEVRVAAATMLMGLLFWWAGSLHSARN